MRTRVRDEAGVELDAEASIEWTGAAGRLVIESRGPQRNPDYIPALHVMVTRLARQRATLREIAVVSSRALQLPAHERRLRLADHPYPISLTSVADGDRLARAIRAAAAAFGRPEGAPLGGNPTKRLQIEFNLAEASTWTPERVERLVLGGPDGTPDPEQAPRSTTSAREDDGEVGTATSTASTYLLTWNPDRFAWTDFQAELTAAERGDSPYMRWSCGNTSSIPVGARVFLLRQGREPRGIIASGWVTHPSHQAPHWDPARRDAGDPAWYIGVGFEVLLDAEREAPLDVHRITDGPLAAVYWAIPASGTRLDVAAAAALAARWSVHVTAARPAGPPALDDPELAAVEGMVRERLMRHRSRERALRAAKLAAARAAAPDGRLQCEVPGCGFDFEARYGAVGAGYAQVHHRRPLGELDAPTLTTLHDLAVVCANCHAMIHRGGACRALETLFATES